jgi:hypothetical protein
VSDGIIINVIDFKVGVEIISSHTPLLVELENIMEGEVNTKAYAKLQTQTHRYVWKEKVKQDFMDCLNDNVSSLYIYGVQFCLQNSSGEEAVNTLNCMIRSAGREMEHRGKVYKKLGMMRNINGKRKKQK